VFQSEVFQLLTDFCLVSKPVNYANGQS